MERNIGLWVGVLHPGIDEEQGQGRPDPSPSGIVAGQGNIASRPHQPVNPLSPSEDDLPRIEQGPEIPQQRYRDGHAHPPNYPDKDGAEVEERAGVAAEPGCDDQAQEEYRDQFNWQQCQRRGEDALGLTVADEVMPPVQRPQGNTREVRAILCAGLTRVRRPARLPGSPPWPARGALSSV